jgi:hypothetical protein
VLKDFHKAGPGSLAKIGSFSEYFQCYFASKECYCHTFRLAPQVCLILLHLKNIIFVFLTAIDPRARMKPVLVVGDVITIWQ